MSNTERINQLLVEIRNNNFGLLNQVKKLNPEDQKIYSKKVAELIGKTVSTIKKPVGAGLK